MFSFQQILEESGDAKPNVKKIDFELVHFVHYQWDLDLNRISLQYYNKELMQAIEWMPKRFKINIVGPRKCIGHYRGTTYNPCLKHRRVIEFPQCYRCVSHSIPVLRCIFEPRCYGDKCPNSICGQPHQLYLAFFNTFPKVGMTSKERLKLRVLEQGADAYSIIATVPDRLSARNLEKKVSKILQLKESYDPEIIIKSLTQKIRTKEIDEKYLLICTSLKDRFNLKCSKLNYLENYPLKVPLRSMPSLRNTFGLHTGKFVGIKGKYLIYDNKGLNAVNLNEMLGNYLMIEKSN